MTLPANGQLSLIQCVPASSCVATLASSPNRSPTSARAASGAARSAAARTSFFTVGLRDGPYSLDHPTAGAATFQSRAVAAPEGGLAAVAPRLYRLPTPTARACAAPERARARAAPRAARSPAPGR